MTLEQRLTAQLTRDEGLVLHAYKDSLGFWTIGVGILIDPAKGCTPPPEMTWPDGVGNITANCTITQDVSDRLLAEHITHKSAELRAALPWVNGLDEARQGVLINMAFNLGVKGLLKFKRTLGSIEGGRYSLASAEMLQSTWARQVGKRADRLAKQMRTGEWV